MIQIVRDRLENLLAFRELLYISERAYLDIIRQSQEMIDDINVSGSESEVSRSGMSYAADLGDFESLTHIIRSYSERLESNRADVELINMEIEQMSVGPAGA